MPPPPPILDDKKITFDCISRHFRSMRNFKFFFNFRKWLPAAILDERKSLSIAFFFKFHKMAAGHSKWLHFGWQKITFDHISHHFRSIRNFFFIKWQYATIFLLNGRRRPFWKCDLGHFGWLKITFDRFRSIRNFCFHKMAIRNYYYYLFTPHAARWPRSGQTLSIQIFCKNYGSVWRVPSTITALSSDYNSYCHSNSSSAVSLRPIRAYIYTLQYRYDMHKKGKHRKFNVFDNIFAQE